MTRLAVAYFREVIGYIDTDGPKDNWESTNTPLARFLENSHPGEKPNTFKFLQPEGWLAGVLEGKNYVEDGIRFLSNLTIVNDGSRVLDKIGIDTLHARLADCTDEHGVFQGSYQGPTSSSFTPTFESDLAELWKNELMPKFSGAQVKIPVSLLPDQNGGHIVMSAVRTTFSHILKVPREGYYASLPATEWLGLELAKRAGLETAEHALVEMPDGMAPALLIERFDLPDINDDLRHLLRISDFCNVTGLPPLEHNKYSTDISVCFAALEKQSSDPEADRIALFKRVVLSTLIGDGDMHLKNISVLKSFDRDTGEVTVRFAPVYDSMTTKIYPELDSRVSALNFDPQPEHGGIYSRSIGSRSDLIEIAEKNGISYNDADAIIDHIAQSVADNVVEISRNPPEIFNNHPACLFALKCAATEIIMRGDAPNPPDWDYDENVWPSEYTEVETYKTTTLAFNGTSPARAAPTPAAAPATAPINPCLKKPDLTL